MWTRWVAVVLLGLALPAGAEGPRLEGTRDEDERIVLSDGKLPLWEIRPLDRRVYVVSLDGGWKKESRPGATYYLNVKFADGTVYSHRPINDGLFYRGEMRFMVPDYLLIRTNTAKGGKLAFFITERPSAGARAEPITRPLELSWPLKRRITSRPPDTKYTPPRPIDSYPLPDDDR